MNRPQGILTVVCALALALPAWAGDPPPFRDFTFKRVKIPGPGATARITVQIDPAEQATYLAVPRRSEAETDEPPAAGAAPGLPFDWYWARVSPSLEQAGAGRLESALRNLADAPSDAVVPAPRLQDMQDIAARYGRDILKATVGTRVSPALVLAVIGIESGGRPNAVSGAGAEGLMQLIPATADRFGVADSKDPVQNIEGGVAYLDFLMEQFDGDPLIVLAAYNAGENAVLSNRGVPPYAETRAYVPKVLAAWQVASGLCMTKPQLISDGCVFNVRMAKNG